MQGTQLYPLNQLKDRFPDIYEEQLAKYRDHPNRLNLPKRVIPKLNCLWNDVVQFSPLHPHIIYQGLVKRGLRVSASLSFFEISLEQIPLDAPIAIFYSNPDADVTAPLADESIEMLDRDQFENLVELPEATGRWFDKLVQEQKVYGLFVGIPHILVQGVVEVDRVITWDHSPAE